MAITYFSACADHYPVLTECPITYCATFPFSLSASILYTGSYLSVWPSFTLHLQQKAILQLDKTFFFQNGTKGKLIYFLPLSSPLNPLRFFSQQLIWMNIWNYPISVPNGAAILPLGTARSKRHNISDCERLLFRVGTWHSMTIKLHKLAHFHNST